MKCLVMQLRDNGNWSGGVPQPFQRFSANHNDGMVNLLLTARDYVNQVSFGLPVYLGTVAVCVKKVVTNRQ
ncbi:hypothetical protein T4A_12479 [Trichinella pseudospiralis]|uniref:Uncharacterized protein n=1 Tax=Trichinella pseudospiralis TaxID=6337 RepID=A0A0V1DMB4_TRIPS|nr:hypothetical protein T4A_12479 [Trichinella pseudospiralis]